MPTVPAVEARHRLHPSDLRGHARTVIIARVTMQGVEEARPLAYFQGLPLPMALTPAQCNDLARITGSAVTRDWVGATVVLDPVDTPDGIACVVRAPGEPLSTRREQPRDLRLGSRLRGLLVAILLGMIFGLVARAEQTRAMLEWIMSLRPDS